MVRTVCHLPGAADGRFESVTVRGTAPVGSRPSVVDISPQYDLSATITIDNLKIKAKRCLADHSDGGVYPGHAEHETDTEEG